MDSESRGRAMVVISEGRGRRGNRKDVEFANALGRLVRSGLFRGSAHGP